MTHNQLTPSPDVDYQEAVKMYPYYNHCETNILVLYNVLYLTAMNNDNLFHVIYKNNKYYIFKKTFFIKIGPDLLTLYIKKKGYLKKRKGTART